MAFLALSVGFSSASITPSTGSSWLVPCLVRWSSLRFVVGIDHAIDGTLVAGGPVKSCYGLLRFNMSFRGILGHLVTLQDTCRLFLKSLIFIKSH